MSRPKIKKDARSTLLEHAHEQLAVWEAFRKLGFQADDIYAAFYNGNELFTTLRVGDKEWNGSISKGKKIPPEPYIALYTAECEKWNKGTAEHRRRIFDAYMPVAKMIDIAIGVRLKGIDIPNLPDAPPAEDLAVLKAFLEGRLVVFDENEHDHVQAQPN